MTSERTPGECRNIVFALLRQRGSLSQQEILHAGPLNKHEVRHAINAMCRTSVIRRIAPRDNNSRAAGRYELTGKALGRHAPSPPAPFSEARFEELSAVWGIALPKSASTAYASRFVVAADMAAAPQTAEALADLSVRESAQQGDAVDAAANDASMSREIRIEA